MLVCRHTVNTSTRQLSVTPAVCKAATATDPIQQLFVDKVRLYGQKSKWVEYTFITFFYLPCL